MTWVDDFLPEYEPVAEKAKVENAFGEDEDVDKLMEILQEGDPPESMKKVFRDEFKSVIVFGLIGALTVLGIVASSLWFDNKPAVTLGEPVPVEVENVRVD